MSDYILLIVPEYSADVNTLNSLHKNATCICCLAQNVRFVNLTECKHTGFLNSFADYKKFNNSLICHNCHYMLKKIEDFKDQVQQNILTFKKKTRRLHKPRHHKLSITVLENVSFTPEIDVTLKEYKQEQYGDEYQDVVVNVKVENDMTLMKVEEELWEESSVDSYLIRKEVEEEMNLEPIKTLKEDYSLIEKKNMEKYLLTSEEMEKERESLKVDEAYLALPFKCDKCIIGFKEEIYLQKHNKQRHDRSIGEYICEVCESVYITKQELDAHYRKHFIRYKCKPLNNGFKDKMTSVTQYQMSTGNYRYQCRIGGCSYETHSYGRLAYHRLMHKKYPCDMCESVYIKWSDLKAHIKEVHSTPPTVYKCDKCPKQFNMRCRLRVHMQAAHELHTENEGVPYCVACRKYFRTDGILKLHMKHHPKHVKEADKIYICDVCGVRYVAKAHLKLHILREHSTVREQCPHCNKLYMNTRNLRRHIDFVHKKITRPRDIMCDYCGKFTTRQALQDHIHTHTGERPYKCTQCSATFAQSGPLYTHKRLVHNPLRESKRNNRKIK